MKPTAVSQPVISQDMIDTYRRDGVVLVRGVFSPEEVEQAAGAINTVLAHPGPLSQVASSADDPGSFTEDFRRWNDVPAIEDLARGSEAGRIAPELMGSATIRFYHEHVLVKEGGTGQRTPWHQDQPITTSTAAGSVPGSRSTTCRRPAASNSSRTPTADRG